MSGGGGYGSKNVVQRPVRTGSGPRSARPAGVAQIGTAVGDHVTALGGSSSPYRGEKLHNDRSFQPAKFGNELATNVGKGGPGAGRQVMSCGSQGQHGDVAGSPRPPGRGFDERG
jgi:hypothetical protein